MLVAASPLRERRGLTRQGTSSKLAQLVAELLDCSWIVHTFLHGKSQASLEQTQPWGR